MSKGLGRRERHILYAMGDWFFHSRIEADFTFDTFRSWVAIYQLGFKYKKGDRFVFADGFHTSAKRSFRSLCRKGFIERGNRSDNDSEDHCRYAYKLTDCGKEFLKADGFWQEVQRNQSTP